MNIDLELYRIFYTVAKCKNISKATEKLYISQPAITQRINNLEKQLDIKLFHRRPDGMKLTPCLYTSTKYIDEHNGKIDLLNKSEHYNFILPKQDSIERKEFDKLCKKNHITIKNKFEIQDINIRKYFVLNGLGIALGFKEYIQEELKKNMFIEIPLQDALPKGNLNWVVLNNESKKNEILKLIEMIKDEERSCN